MISIKENETYLVTGGSGFLGTALVKYITGLNAKVRVIARDEGNLIKLKQKFPSIEIYTGDISDVFEVQQACKNVNGIFHLAASKHVGLAEKFVRENVKTNVIGALNLLEESLSNKNIKFVLGISTDKAAQVSGVYGATKFVMERLFKQYEQLNTECKYRIVRYGNVLYSTGSVLCKWKELIEEGKDLIITHPSATRFFWNVDQAIDLIKNCMMYATDTSPYCPTMKAMTIENLVEAMIQKYAKGKRPNIQIIGLQQGENMHEKVLEQGPYSNEVEQFTIEEIKELI